MTDSSRQFGRSRITFQSLFWWILYCDINYILCISAMALSFNPCFGGSYIVTDSAQSTANSANSFQSLFWVFIFIVAFYVLVFSNEGAIRYYNFLGFALGAGFYGLSLSALVIKGMLFLLWSIKNFVYDTYKLMKYPFSVTLCLISVPYNCCKRQIKPLYYKARRIGGLPKNIIRDTGKAIKVYFKKK